KARARTRLDALSIHETDPALMEQTIASIEGAGESIEALLAELMRIFYKASAESRQGNLTLRQQELAEIPKRIQDIFQKATEAANASFNAEIVGGSLSIASGAAQFTTGFLSVKSSLELISETKAVDSRTAADVAKVANDVQQENDQLQALKQVLPDDPEAKKMASQAGNIMENARGKMGPLAADMEQNQSAVKRLNEYQQLKMDYSRSRTAVGEAVSHALQGAGRFGSGSESQGAAMLNADQRRQESTKDYAMTRTQQYDDFAKEAQSAANEARQALQAILQAYIETAGRINNNI
ncbi:MAG: hypothetical protein ACO1N5_08390, partial [Noviherbaspirillum sp.]